MKKILFSLVSLIPVLLLQNGCATGHTATAHRHHAEHAHAQSGDLAHAGNGAAATGDKHASAWAAITEVIAVMHPTEGNKCRGQVRFVQAGEKVKITATIEGLTPNQRHAIHIHEFGDCSAPDAISAGGHYNPEGHPHGLTHEAHRHAGDLGNLQADINGRARYEITVDNISLAGLKNPIIGRSVIIHAKEDDGGQPVGNAGPRIACGVIGIASKAK
jgi:superoxide dismutase, Cu-Zn family